VLKKHRPKAAALMVVSYDEGYLRLTVVNSIVSTDSNELITNRRHKCDAINVINMGKPMKITLREFGIRGEEA
jgi:hypothetical protein